MYLKQGDAAACGQFGGNKVSNCLTLTSRREECLGILRDYDLQLGYLFPECLDVLLHKAAIIHCSEQDPALALTLSLPTVSAAFGSATSWHSSSGRRSGWGKKRRQLDVTVPDSVSSLLL